MHSKKNIDNNWKHFRVVAAQRLECYFKPLKKLHYLITLNILLKRRRGPIKSRRTKCVELAKFAIDQLFADEATDRN